MHLISSLTFVACLASTLVSASDCTLKSNFPSFLSKGQVIPITPTSSSDTSSIQGSIQIIDGCSFQFVDFSLSHALQSKKIKVYGVVHSREIAVVVSHQVLAGKFHHLSVGPTINFTGSGSFVIQDDGQGVSWADFTMFRIFSETSRQVIGEISIPGALQNPRTLPVEENRSKTVLPPKPVAPKDVKKTEQNNAGGYTLMSMGTFSLVILSVSFAVSIIN